MQLAQAITTFSLEPIGAPIIEEYQALDGTGFAVGASAIVLFLVIIYLSLVAATNRRIKRQALLKETIFLPFLTVIAVVTYGIFVPWYSAMKGPMQKIVVLLLLLSAVVFFVTLDRTYQRLGLTPGLRRWLIISRTLLLGLVLLWILIL